MTPGRGKTKSDVWYTTNSLSSALLSETLCFSNVFKYIVLIHCIVCNVFIKQILTFDTCIWAFLEPSVSQWLTCWVSNIKVAWTKSFVITCIIITGVYPFLICRIADVKMCSVRNL